MAHSNLKYENRTVPLAILRGLRLTKNPHIHKEIEIVYAAQGHAIAYADQNQFELKAGDIFFAFPNQVHYYDILEPGLFYVILPAVDTLLGAERFFAEQIPWNNVLHIAPDEPAHQVMLALMNAYENKDTPYRITALNGYTNLLVSMLLPRFTLHQTDTTSHAPLYDIMNYCSQHYSDELSLAFLSSELHLSKYYISHLINANLHMGLNEYINLLRVNAATQLLKKTDRKISDIAQDVGFGTIRSFNRAFRQQLDMTPVDYRTSCRQTDIQPLIL